MSKRYCIFLSALFCAFLAVFLVVKFVQVRRAGVKPSEET